MAQSHVLFSQRSGLILLVACSIRSNCVLAKTVTYRGKLSLSVVIRPDIAFEIFLCFQAVSFPWQQTGHSVKEGNGICPIKIYGSFKLSSQFHRCVGCRVLGVRLSRTPEKSLNFQLYHKCSLEKNIAGCFQTCR